MTGNESYSHCPKCGQQIIGGQVLCGHLPFTPPDSGEARQDAGRQDYARCKICGGAQGYGSAMQGGGLCNCKPVLQDAPQEDTKIGLTTEELAELGPKLFKPTAPESADNSGHAFFTTQDVPQGAREWAKKNRPAFLQYAQRYQVTFDDYGEFAEAYAAYVCEGRDREIETLKARLEKMEKA